MSKKHKKNPDKMMPQKNKQSAPIIVGTVIAAAAVAAYLGFWWKSEVKAIGNSVNATTVSKTDFNKLKGKWLRPDGGYVLEIKQIASNGKIDAAYLNPRPIHVSKGIASVSAGQTKVFVELRDRLYPGSYYTLTYNVGKDQLTGVYHHLGIGQQFDVVFVRMK